MDRDHDDVEAPSAAPASEPGRWGRDSGAAVHTPDDATGGGKGRGVRCPYCGADEGRVIDSRITDGGEAIRRRRACHGCDERFSTYERVEPAPLRVRKRSGVVEPFDRDKVAKGIARATTNLPLEPRAIPRAVARVEGRLRDRGLREVDSGVVGAEVLAALHDVHEVAYVRFASVYKGFTTPEDFHRELASLEKAAPPKPAADGPSAATPQAIDGDGAAPRPSDP